MVSARCLSCVDCWYRSHACRLILLVFPVGSFVSVRFGSDLNAHPLVGFNSSIKPGSKLGLSTEDQSTATKAASINDNGTSARLTTIRSPHSHLHRDSDSLSPRLLSFLSHPIRSASPSLVPSAPSQSEAASNRRNDPKQRTGDQGTINNDRGNSLSRPPIPLPPSILLF